MAEKEEKIKTDADLERTEILYGPDNIVKRTIDDCHKIQERLDSCTDSLGPSVLLNDLIWNEFIELKNRGIRLRFITEITRENVNFSKELLKVTELRYLKLRETLAYWMVEFMVPPQAQKKDTHL